MIYETSGGEFTLRDSPNPLNVLSIREPPARLGSTKATVSVSCLDLRVNGPSAKAYLRTSRDVNMRWFMKKYQEGV